MSALALKAYEDVAEAVIVSAQSQPCKVVALRTGLTERGVRCLRDREHAPSMETAMRFGFVYPTVATVIAHWTQKMTQPDFFEPETQRRFHQDMNRAGGRA